MDALGVNHSAERSRDVRVAVEVVEHQPIWYQRLNVLDVLLARLLRGLCGEPAPCLQLLS